MTPVEKAAASIISALHGRGIPTRHLTGLVPEIDGKRLIFSDGLEVTVHDPDLPSVTVTTTKGGDPTYLDGYSAGFADAMKKRR